MAASIKISELNSLANLTDVDLFLVSDMESTTSKKVSYSSLKSNVTADVSSALTNLTNVVSQNKTSAETLVESVRAALQAAVDANATGYAAADSALDSAIVALQATVNNLDIDIAPETLNSINELAAAMGDDPTFLTTLQTRLTTIESDNATQTELDAAAALKLNVNNPTYTGTITGPDLAIDTDKLTISSAGGVVASVGFFTGGMLTVGGNASLTGNTTFSGGVANFTNGLKINGTLVTPTADELNYVTGVTSNIQTQLTSLQTTVTNLDIDIAPETLDSINELAAAMGDDPAFLTTLQGRVTTIESDIATQTELDASVATLVTGDATIQAALDTYKAEIEDRNLQLALAYDTPLFVESLNAG